MESKWRLSLPFVFGAGKGYRGGWGLYDVNTFFHAEPGITTGLAMWRLHPAGNQLIQVGYTPTPPGWSTWRHLEFVAGPEF